MNAPAKIAIPIAVTTPLSRLVAAALAAEDALRNPGLVTDDDYARLDDAAIAARVALRCELESYGLTVEQINRMGSVL